MSHKMLPLVIGILGVACVGNAQLVQIGHCESINLMQNFELDAFATGTWYELGRAPSQNTNCANLAFTTSEESVSVVNKFVVDNLQYRVSGTATHTAGTAQLLLQLPSSSPTAFWILASDYSNYAIAMNCINVNTQTREINIWQLGRDVNSYDSAAILGAANNALSTIGLTVADLQTIDHSSAVCTPNGVVLHGECPVVAGINFSTSILGNWYDVAHYPTVQNGSCSRIEYIFEFGMTIRNLMVVDEQLKVRVETVRPTLTAEGVMAIMLDNDEKLSILGTDYTSYSLVYSCRNLGDGNRQVLSWKLSRTPNLTDEANAAIGDIISNTDGLFEDFYQPQSHSDRDCYYVPDLEPGQSVLFPGGSCENIDSMEGFNYTRYLGWWHEIERYSTDEPRGQCTSVDISPDLQSEGSSLQAVETGVYDGVGNVTTYRATVLADGSLLISENPGAIRRWFIRDTDYETYSLLQSCEEVDTSWGRRRRVWSAKHSKARSLTPAAHDAMNPFIAAHPDLHHHLYEAVDQSDSACFYYPAVGEQVVLPGQCDTDIPVQENFDVSRFTGTWYQLERYPYPRVSNRSECIGSRYTVDGDSVTVQNWEVLDGVLNTIVGSAAVNGANLTVMLPLDDGDEIETTVLQILRTDYVNYALVYACVNVNDFQRTIRAFKLSRGRSMSYIGLWSIDNYMATRPEFHRPYFIRVPQSTDCEEPSSALLVKGSIFVTLCCVVLQFVMIK